MDFSPDKSWRWRALAVALGGVVCAGASLSFAAGSGGAGGDTLAPAKMRYRFKAAK